MDNGITAMDTEKLASDQPSLHDGGTDLDQPAQGKAMNEAMEQGRWWVVWGPALHDPGPARGRRELDRRVPHGRPAPGR